MHPVCSPALGPIWSLSGRALSSASKAVERAAAAAATAEAHAQRAAAQAEAEAAALAKDLRQVPGGGDGPVEVSRQLAAAHTHMHTRAHIRVYMHMDMHMCR